MEEDISFVTKIWKLITTHPSDENGGAENRNPKYSLEYLTCGKINRQTNIQ